MTEKTKIVKIEVFVCVNGMEMNSHAHEQRHKLNYNFHPEVPLCLLLIETFNVLEKPYLVTSYIIDDDNFDQNGPRHIPSKGYDTCVLFVLTAPYKRIN